MREILITVSYEWGHVFTSKDVKFKKPHHDCMTWGMSGPSRRCEQTVAV